MGIVDDFYDLNGILPSVNNLSAILARIKAGFAEEAVEDAEDYQVVDVDASLGADFDYDETNWEDEAQYLADLEEDYGTGDSSSSEEEEKVLNEEDELQKYKKKMPIKRAK